MLIIGLMLIRNENDILREVLAEHFKFSDHIFVLDGTTEDSKLSKEICQSFENISHYTENQLPSHYPHPIRDGCRQFLVERAREKFGAQGWFVILHGDEIFVDSPRKIIKKYDFFFDCLSLDNMLFFIHKEQYPFKFNPDKSVQEQIYWHAGPGSPEMRMFKNRLNYNYDIHQHHNLTPQGIRINYKTTYKIKHYPFRDPDQQARRAHDRLEVTKFSPLSYKHVFAGQYYLDESFFGRKFLYWISKKKLKPRINDGFWVRLSQDLADNLSRKRIR